MKEDFMENENKKTLQEVLEAIYLLFVQLMSINF